LIKHFFYSTPFSGFILVSLKFTSLKLARNRGLKLTIVIPKHISKPYLQGIISFKKGAFLHFEKICSRDLHGWFLQCFEEQNANLNQGVESALSYVLYTLAMKI